MIVKTVLYVGTLRRYRNLRIVCLVAILGGGQERLINSTKMSGFQFATLCEEAGCRRTCRAASRRFSSVK